MDTTGFVFEHFASKIIRKESFKGKRLERSGWTLIFISRSLRAMHEVCKIIYVYLHLCPPSTIIWHSSWKQDLSQVFISPWQSCLCPSLLKMITKHKSLRYYYIYYIAFWNPSNSSCNRPFLSFTMYQLASFLLNMTLNTLLRVWWGPFRREKLLRWVSTTFNKSFYATTRGIRKLWGSEFGSQLLYLMRNLLVGHLEKYYRSQISSICHLFTYAVLSLIAILLAWTIARCYRRQS